MLKTESAASMLDVIRFDSVAEQVEDVTEIKDKLIKLGRYHPFADLKGNEKFIGKRFKSLDQIFKLLDGTWDEGMKIYDEMLAQLHDEDIAPPVDTKRRGVWSDTDGEDFDYDRFTKGQDFWRTSTRGKRQGSPVITIATDLSTSAYVDSHKILWRGAAAVCLCELLEQAGYRVELWAINTISRPYTNSNNSLAIGTMLKSPEDPINASALINLVSGWAFRTFTFMSYHLIGKDISRSYGHPINITQEILNEFTHADEVMIIEHVWEMAEAVACCKKKLAKFSNK